MTKELTIKEMLEASRAEVLRLETLIEDKNAEIKHLNWLSGDLIKSFFDNSREIDKLERKLAQKLETAMISDSRELTLAMIDELMEKLAAKPIDGKYQIPMDFSETDDPEQARENFLRMARELLRDEA